MTGFRHGRALFSMIGVTLMSQPLDGIRVLDLTRLLPGPYASQILADFGADVLKIEEPSIGDYARLMSPTDANGTGLVFVATNRNKRSMTLNLKSEQGRDIFRLLVKQFDVVLESFRPGVMERLQLDYERLRTLNPALVYCAITGYGQDGPYRLRAGHDLNYQGYSGLLDYNRGPNGEPAMPSTQFGDLVGGSYMALTGVLMALVERTRTGLGRMVDVSMTEGLQSLLPLVTAPYLSNGTAPVPGQSALDGGLPCYNIYETSDGKYVTLAALEEKFWHTFCMRIDHPELLPFHTPTTTAERDSAISVLRTIFKTKTRDEWLTQLADIDACVGPVYTIDEALHDSHAQARDVIFDAETSQHRSGKNDQPQLSRFPHLSDSEPYLRLNPPKLGAHTDAMLHELGYDQDAIEQLRMRGIV
jgi:alpha-methylacyl-CoA racemase